MSRGDAAIVIEGVAKTFRRGNTERTRSSALI